MKRLEFQPWEGLKGKKPRVQAVCVEELGSGASNGMVPEKVAWLAWHAWVGTAGSRRAWRDAHNPASTVKRKTWRASTAVHIERVSHQGLEVDWAATPEQNLRRSSLRGQFVWPPRPPIFQPR